MWCSDFAPLCCFHSWGKDNTGYTDPASTAGWGIVDFDWSNGKGTGTADGGFRDDSNA